MNNQSLSDSWTKMFKSPKENYMVLVLNVKTFNFSQKNWKDLLKYFLNSYVKKFIFIIFHF